MQDFGLFDLIKAIVFGIVEGITEWLPISSTGHMLLLEQFVHLNCTPEFWNMFLVVIQLGAIMAVVVLYFDRLNPFSRRKTGFERRSIISLWLKIIIACIPAALVGIPLDDWMEEHLGSPFVIAAALIAYGIAFILIEDMRGRGSRAAVLRDAAAPIQDVNDMSWTTALGIGCFQVLSLVPGTSRSGSTIIGGLLLGCSRAVAAEFTFFMAIPVMFGASSLRLAKYFLQGGSFGFGEITTLMVGCLVAFVVSIIAIRMLMDYVRSNDFKPFGWYRIILGIAVIVWFAFFA